MLFNLKYVNHPVENLHTFIEHTVFDVWCKPSGVFNISMLHKDFMPIVEEVSKNKNDYLKQPIEEIYNICQLLKKTELEFLKAAFKQNNAIEELCIGTIKPILYADIVNKIDVKLPPHQKLSPILKDFCKNLYNHVLKLKSFSSRNGELDEYYDAFMVENNVGVCPFCGLSDLKSDLLSKRDAYDHYLPKDSYPFNTVNFKNLVPACNTCNSPYKQAIDPIDGGNRLAYFPFSKNKPNFEIKLNINSIDFEDPKKNNLSLTINSAQQSEVEAWRETYGINERYSDKCKSADSKYWIEQVRELVNYGLDIKGYFPTYIFNRKQTPFLEKNFLRVPFLEECMTIGIFG
jgi:hypothetical protein